MRSAVTTAPSPSPVTTGLLGSIATGATGAAVPRQAMGANTSDCLMVRWEDFKIWRFHARPVVLCFVWGLVCSSRARVGATAGAYGHGDGGAAGDLAGAQVLVVGGDLDVVVALERREGDGDAGDDAAAAIANDSEYGLAASIWSSDNARALALAERIQAGSVWINDAHQINCQVPFGGYKQSGLGRELGPDALDAYTETKTVHLDLSGGRDAKPYDILLSHAE